MPYQHGILYLLGADGRATEIINHARTTAYLAGVTFDNGVQICDVLADGGCAAYGYAPPCGPDAPEEEWAPLALTTPDTGDVAPWYLASYPESADAFGFWIEEWTGLDDAHIVRPTSATGGAWGGSQLGTLRSNERVMKLNVILFGRNEAALEYLFRWLSTVLSSVCSTCATDSVMLRRICPTNGDQWQGVVRLDKVGLVEGLHWESDPTTQSMCSVRRVSFGLTAGDPCMYLGHGETVASASEGDGYLCITALSSSISTTRYPCRSHCSELASDFCRTVFTVDVPPSISATAPTITLENQSDEHSLAVRLVCYADPNEVGVSPNPCGLPILGELYVRPLPPWSTLQWDVCGRKVTYLDAGTGVPVPGAAFIDPNDRPQRRFFVAPCGQLHAVMELASMCYDIIGAEINDGSFVYVDPHFPTMSMSIGERIGCV